MRRELIIIAGVLIPFAALVVLGWIFTRPEMPRGEAQVERSNPSPQPSPHGERGLVVLPVLDAGDDAGNIDPALAAPLKAVAAQVQLCFDDRSEHVRDRVAVQVAFRPTEDGGFDHIRIESGGLPDPTFAACIEDVFAEVHFEPSGRETFVPATHTFVFDPPRR